MDKPPSAAYQGDEPYVFVCYSHDDRDLVFSEMDWLRKQGVNLWYDEGISPGEEWSEELGQAITNAERILFFVTPNSVASRHCRNEVHFAQNHDTPILAVHLEETQLPVGLDLAISTSQGILAFELAQEIYRGKLLQALETKSTQARGSPPSVTQKQAPTASLAPSKSTRGLLLTVSTAAVIVIATLVGFQIGNDGKTALEPIRSDIPRLAIFPFENRSDNQEDRYFTDGLVEGIATALSRFPLLIIIPPDIAAKYEEEDDAAIATKLGVRYLLRGSVRRNPSEVLVLARLVDPRDSVQLWAENYSSNLESADLFVVQARIAEQIAAELANSTGIIVNFGLKDLRENSTDSAEPYECVLRGYAYIAIHTEETHREARDCLERAVGIDENSADVWAHLAYLYQEEFHHNRNLKPQPLDRALRAGLRAVELDQTNIMGHFALAMTHFSRGELKIAINQMDRALALNPTDTVIMSALAVIYVYAGDIEKGIALVDRAFDLHRTPPAFIYQALAAANYLRGNYEQALLDLSSWSPSLPTDGQIFKTASLGMLGRKVDAQSALDTLLTADEVFANNPRGELRRLFLASTTIQAITNGLTKAGLQFASRPR